MTHQPTTMKTYLATILRHAFTALAGLGGFLLSKGLIDSADVTQVNSAGVSLGAALAVIISAIAGRFLLTLLGKVFSGAAGESGSGSSGGVNLLLMCITAAGLMGCLPSCSTTQIEAAKSIPVRTTLHTDYGTATYSSKSGLEVDVDATSGK
jgi:hypothetical protein